MHRHNISLQRELENQLVRIKTNEPNTIHRNSQASILNFENLQGMTGRSKEALKRFKQFKQENPGVGSCITEIKYAINGNIAHKANSIEDFETSEHALAVFVYRYKVVYLYDRCMIPVFFNSDGTISDSITVDGWKMSFSRPTTRNFHYNGTQVYMEKGDLIASVPLHLYKVRDGFPKVWEFFSKVRKLSTQKEVEEVEKFFRLENEYLYRKLKLDDLEVLYPEHFINRRCCAELKRNTPKGIVITRFLY